MAINIALLLDNIRSTQNVGSIMRTADCFGVKHIYFSGYTPYPAKHSDDRLPHLALKINNRISKTALGAEKTINFSTYTDHKKAIIAAKNDGYKNIVCLEQNDKSIPLQSYIPKSDTLLILGNEVSGIPEWTLSNADVILEIPQYGKKESLNVSNATAIALYALKTSTYEII